MRCEHVTHCQIRVRARTRSVILNLLNIVMAERVGVDNLLEEKPGSSGTSHTYPRGDIASFPDVLPRSLRGRGGGWGVRAECHVVTSSERGEVTTWHSARTPHPPPRPRREQGRTSGNEARGDRPSSYREYLYNPDSMPKRLRSKLEKQLSAADTNNTHAVLGSDMLTPMLQEEAEYSKKQNIQNLNQFQRIITAVLINYYIFHIPYAAAVNYNNVWS